MKCQFVNLPGGGVMIACGARRRDKRCKCGRIASLLCDWKVKRKKSGTCDKPICEQCSMSPAPDKDLCLDHAEKFKRWKTERLL
jgi:hypothetical protein